MLKLYEKFDAPALLRYLTPDDCSLLFASTETYQYSKGEHIIFDEDSEAILYLIEEGRVEILVQQDAQKVSVAKLSAGDIIGELSFLTGLRRSADVVALDDATIRFIEPDRIASLLRDNSGFAARLFYSICQILAERVIVGNRRVAELERAHKQVHLHIQEPTASWARKMLFHAQQEIQSTERGISVSFPYTEPFVLIQQLLALGPDCEVLHPPELRERMAKTLQQMVKQYS